MSEERKWVQSSALREDKTFKLRQQKKRAQKMEKTTAKRFGGRQQPRSGGGMFNKGDVKLANVLVDDKYTDKLSYSLTQKDIVKLCEEARQEGFRKPAFKVRFDKPIPDMTEFPKEWVVIPVGFFEELLQNMEKDDE